MLMARDTARDEAQKLHRKWLKHQAFMAELARNKEWLAKIEQVSGGHDGGGMEMEMEGWRWGWGWGWGGQIVRAGESGGEHASVREGVVAGKGESVRHVITLLSFHHFAGGHPELHSQGYIALVAVLFRFTGSVIPVALSAQRLNHLNFTGGYGESYRGHVAAVKAKHTQIPFIYIYLQVVSVTYKVCSHHENICRFFFWLPHIPIMLCCPDIPPQNVLHALCLGEAQVGS